MKKHTPFTKAARHVSLSASERMELRDRLVSYMEYHPLRTQTAAAAQRHSVGHYAHRMFVAFGARSMRMRPLVGAAAVFILIAVPVAAEQAVPGDVLYPIKVQVNEGIRSQLAFSPYDKVEWETERVERRIAEARMLAKEGKLTEERENALEATVRQHTAAFQEQLNEIRAVDAEGAAIAEVTLESALDVQSAVLDTEAAAQASSTGDARDGNVSELAAIVREARADVASSSTQSAPSYERLLARVEENLTRVRALADSLPADVTNEQRDAIFVYITDAEEDVTAAKEAHAAGESEDAIARLRTALATTQKLGAFMSNRDVRAHVSLSVLIPKEPSDASRLAALQTALALFTEKRELLEKAQGAVVEAELETYVSMLTSLDELLSLFEEQITDAALEQAERTAREIEGLIAELERLIVQEPQEPNTGTTTPPVPPEVFIPGPDIE